MIKKYFPVLKAKAGELKAIETLAQDEKIDLSPVIELLPESYESTMTKLQSSWTFENNQILVDPYFILSVDPDVTEVGDFFDGLQSQNINAIPVLRLDSIDDYIILVKNYIHNYDSLFCIRVTNEFAKPRTFNALIFSMLEELEASPDKCILLFDLSYCNSENYQHLSNSATVNLRSLRSATDFYQIVIASGSFPKDLSGIPARTEMKIPRYEAVIWEQITSDDDINVDIYYGDYGIKHPIYDADSAQFQSTASVKYSTDTDFYIFRGIKPGDHPNGNGQYILHCKSLVTKPEYDTAAFSWADNEIDTYAAKVVTDRPGNAETWVKIGHSRHFSKLLSLL